MAEMRLNSMVLLPLTPKCCGTMRCCRRAPKADLSSSGRDWTGAGGTAGPGLSTEGRLSSGLPRKGPSAKAGADNARQNTSSPAACQNEARTPPSLFIPNCPTQSPSAFALGVAPRFLSRLPFTGPCKLLQKLSQYTNYAKKYSLNC